MAGTTFTIKGNVIVEGTKEATAEAKVLNKELEKVQATQNSLGKTKMAKAAYSRASSTQENVDYGVTRGMREGGTGASGRDFAQQAQGLGGIVRLYATYAANLFAVTAAFTALENAATKSRMIEASELMSARVGASMKNLSKNIQEATGYAVGLEEAFQFGALGTSAGLATTQIKNLVVIAKGASNALGRDSTDSIRRIIQGTAKQEQEILDELGIFVKAKDAYEKYAKQMNIKGGGDALSSQQKVIAFANAVEQAGEKWKAFAEIEDPFSKFTSKGKEAIFGILSAANQAFIPLLNLISESSNGIAALAGLIGIKLVKQALPQVGQAFKEFMTFDKLAKSTKATQALDNLHNAFKDTAVKIAAEKTKLDKLLGSNIDTSSKSWTDKYTQELKTAGRTNTAIFGTSAKPKDTSKFKNELDVQKAIEKSMVEQVAAAKNKDAVLAKLHQQGLITAASTEKAMVFEAKTQAMAKDAWVSIQKKNAFLAQELEFRASIAALETKQNATKAEIDTTRALRGGMVVAAANAGLFSRSMLVATNTVDGFKVGLGSATVMSTRFSNAMAGGMISSIVGFARTLGTVPALLGASVTGLTGLARTAAGAGAVIGVLGATISAAFSLILGPVMIAYTVWQLFGDKIKSVLGITNEYSDANKRVTAIQTQSNETFKTYSVALTDVNSKKQALNITSNEYAAIITRELKIGAEARTASQEQIVKLEEELALRKKLKEAGVVAKTKDDGSLEEISSMDAAKLAMHEYSVEKKKGMAIDEERLALLYYHAKQVEKVSAMEVDGLKKTEEGANAYAEANLRVVVAKEALAALTERNAGAQAAEIEKWKTSGSTLDEVTKEFSKMDEKIAGLDRLPGIVNPALNSIGKQGLFLIKEIGDIGSISYNTLMAAVGGLEGYGDKARRAGVDVAKLTSDMILLQGVAAQMIASAGDPQAMKSLEYAAKVILERIQTGIKSTNAGLVSSKYNTDFKKGSEKRVKLIKDEKDKESERIETASKVAIDSLKRQTGIELKMLEFQHTSGEISTAAYNAKKISISTEAGTREVAEMEKTQAAKKEILNKEILGAYKVYEQNMKLAGKDKDLKAQALEQFSTFSEGKLDSMSKYDAAVDARKDELKNSRWEMEAEQVAALKARIVALKDELRDMDKDYARFWEDEALASEKAARELQNDSASFTLDPKSKEMAKAKYAETERYNSLILQQTRAVADAQEELQIMTDRQGINGAELELYKDKVGRAADQLNRLKDSAESAGNAAANMAGLRFENEQYENLKTGVADAIMTGLEEGGDAGKKKLRDVIVAALREPINVFVNAIVNSVMGNGTKDGGGITGMLGSASEIYQGYQNGGLGGAFQSAFNAYTGGSGNGANSMLSSLSNWYNGGTAANAGMNYSIASGTTSSSLGATGSAGASQAGSSTYSLASGATNTGGLGATAGGGTTGLTGSTAAAGGGGAAAAGGGTAAASSSMYAYLGYAALIAAAVMVAKNLYEKGYTRAALGYGEEETVKIGKHTNYTADNNIGQSNIYDASIENGMRKFADFLGMSEKWADILSGTTRMGTLFGRKLKAYGMQADFKEGESEVSGYARYKGGVLTSNKTVKIDVDPRDAQNFKSQVDIVKAGTIAMARGLGYSSEAIEKYTGSVRVNFKNATTAEEMSKRYAEAMDDLQLKMLNSVEGVNLTKEAFIQMKEEAMKLAEASGYSASSVATTIRDGMLGRLSEAQVGEALGEQIVGSIYNAMAQGFAEQITGAITSLIIQPIMMSIMAGGTVSAAVSQVSIDAVLASAKNAIAAFSAILNDPAIQGMLAQVMQMTKQLAGVVVKPVGAIRTFTSSMKGAGNAAAEAAKKIRDERYGLEGRLLEMLKKTTVLRERELAQLHASNRPLQQRIWALEDAAEALDNSFSALERAIEARKEEVQIQLDATTELRDKLQDVFNTLKDNINDLLNISAPQMKAFEAKAIIAAALSAGKVEDNEKLSEAIDTLRNGMEDTVYQSAVEENIARMTLVSQLSGLKDLIEPQLTAAEATIKAMEEQLKALDVQLEVSKAQLDSLKGIDTSVISVEAAVGNLAAAVAQYSLEITASNAAVANALSYQAPSTGGSGGGSGGGGGGGTSGAKQWTAEGYWQNNKDLRDEYTRIAALDPNFTDTRFIKDPNVSYRDEYLLWHWENGGKDQHRKYAAGGQYPGGLAMVGEQGPELINFRNPGMIYTAAQTQNLMKQDGGSKRQEELTQQLIEEIQQLRFETQATATHTNKTFRLLDRVSRNGKSLLVTDLPA